MRRIGLLLLLTGIAACDKPTTGLAPGGTTTTTAGTAATTVAWWERTPNRPEDAEKNKQKLVGRWFTRDKLPAGYGRSYEFKTDGTFVLLDQDGNPQKGGGTWKILRGWGTEGAIGFAGESAPSKEPLYFSFTGDAFLLTVPPTPEAPQGQKLIYLRPS